jgi:hypothetical protein
VLNIVVIVALVLSGLNWLVFAGVTLFVDLPALRQFRAGMTGAVAPRSQTTADLDRLVQETGALAGAFRRAGAAPTAAAMSVVCLVIATIAAGIAKL